MPRSAARVEEAPPLAAFAGDVRAGLLAQPKRLPARWFYDALGSALFEAAYGHLLVSGNCYIEAVAIEREVRELFALRPDRIKVVPGRDGWPLAYDYTVGGATVRLDQGALPVPQVLQLVLEKALVIIPPFLLCIMSQERKVEPLDRLAPLFGELCANAAFFLETRDLVTASTAEVFHPR